ncbi:MAG TPA: glycosyltransferase [Terriglobales bacterium]
MRIFAFGSSITSSFWNGAATYYRGIYRQLARLGHEITFAEPDIYGRQQNRDVSEIEYANVMVYRTPQDLESVLRRSLDFDLVIKHSGVGADDELLEKRVLEAREHGRLVAFWDVDAPATLHRVEDDRADAFRTSIPQYDFVFTYGGGESVIRRYLALGARSCYPIYNALDPESHFPVDPDESLQCDLVFVGNRLPDREKRVEAFFLRAAELAPEMSFILGGEGWAGKRLPLNVRWIGHVGTSSHNRINCSARMVLNINRESMADTGFSPPTRVFEAAGAGACMITDYWEGIGTFFEPGREILVARDAMEIVRHLREKSQEQCQRLGSAMRARALQEHTYELRAGSVDQILGSVEETKPDPVLGNEYSSRERTAQEFE